MVPSALRDREGMRTAEGVKRGEVAHTNHSLRDTPFSSPMQLLEPAVFPGCSLELHGAKVSFLGGCPGQACEACQYQLSSFFFFFFPKPQPNFIYTHCKA